MEEKKTKIKKDLFRGIVCKEDNRKIAGITLISLVITVIILLILAGISIAQLTENGLFEKAKLAKEISKNAQEDEDEQIAKYTNEIDSYVDGNRDNFSYNYSLNEQVVGTWLDGKPVYQKTFQGSYTLTTTTSIISGITVANAKHLLDVKCVQDNGVIGDYYIASPSVAGFNASSQLRMSVTNNLTAKYITLTYTKTTD